MKKNSLLFTLLLAGITTFSQVIDKNAEDIIKEVTTKMQSYETIRIEFTYILENKDENIKESKSGSIYIQSDKYRLYINDQLLISDGKTQWAYTKDINEVQIYEVDPEDEYTPMKMLTGSAENFRPKLIREVAEGGKTVQIVDLTPVEPQSFYKIRLEIDKNEKSIISSAIYDKEGTTFTYKVDKFHENPKIHPSRFTFSHANYPGVIVTDMR